MFENNSAKIFDAKTFKVVEELHFPSSYGQPKLHTNTKSLRPTSQYGSGKRKIAHDKGEAGASGPSRPEQAGAAAYGQGKSQPRDWLAENMRATGKGSRSVLPALSATNGLGGQQQKAREAANSASNPDAASTPGDVSGERSTKREAGGKGTAKGPDGRA